MLSGLSELFGRKFVVGFFLPSVLFAIVSIIIASIFLPNLSIDILSFVSDPASIWTAAVILFCVWILSIVLLTLNRVLIRFLEGYGFLSKTKLLDFQLRRYDQLKIQLDEISNQYFVELENDGFTSPKTARQHAQLLLKFRENYPPAREYVLATTFGNVI